MMKHWPLWIAALLIAWIWLVMTAPVEKHYRYTRADRVWAELVKR